MQKVLKKVFDRSLFFIVPYLIILAGSCIVMLIYSKSTIHIWFNSHHDGFWDVFFSKITFLGDGMFVIGVTVFLLFFRFGNSLLAGITYAVSSLIVQISKRFIFEGMPRPKLYFEGKYSLHFVDGVDIYLRNSFPSGHSASVFALFLSLALITRYPFIKIFLLGLAVIVSYSRIYLSQHFLIDVSAGSLIGVLTTLIYYYYHLKYHQSWMDESLISIINTRKKEK